MSAPRLPNFDYKGQYAYFITVNCYQNQNFFTQQNIVSTCLKYLRLVMDEHLFTVYIYCFMTSHLHLLIVGKSEIADMRKAMKIFKQKTGYYFKQEHQKNLWQSSFYDYVLRKDEDIEKVARYILENPVRAGLIKNFWEYKYSGSFIFDIKDFI